MVINHDESRALRIPEDYIVICDWSHTQAAVLQVLEEATSRLVWEMGETPQTVDRNVLWLVLSYHDFYERTLHFFSTYALRKAVEDLEKRGWMEARYVRINGEMIVYQSNEEAQADKTHTGKITKQYRFRFDLVQAEINRKFSPESENSARGGNKSHERVSLS